MLSRAITTSTPTSNVLWDRQQPLEINYPDTVSTQLITTLVPITKAITINKWTIVNNEPLVIQLMLWCVENEGKRGIYRWRDALGMWRC